MRPFDKAIEVGDSADLPVKGDYIRLDDAAPTCTVEVVASMDETLIGHRVTMRGGDGFKFQSEFTRLVISHDEASAQEITGLVGFGELQSSRTGGSVAISGAVDVSGSAVDVTGSDVGVKSGSSVPTYADLTLVAATTTLFLGVVPNRKEAHISNLSTNTSPIRVGDVNTGISAGIEVLPGQTLILEVSGAIYVWSAGTPTLGRVEVTK